MSELTTISCGSVTATIDSMGAQLMSLSRDGGEYLWQGEESIWPRRAPVLFPIVGVLRGNRATSAQGEVTLQRHGIARLYDHAIVGRTESSVTYELASTEETRAAYPYDFRLNMSYSVADGALAQTFRVTNTGDVTLPFTVGGHPAFNVPAPGCGGESFGDYALEFDEPWTARVPRIDEAGLHDFSNMTELFSDSDRYQLSHDVFERMLTLVFPDVPGRRVRLVGPSGHGVEVAFDGFGYLGVWTASADAPFVAIEPWVGCATAYDESDVFEEKRGMVFLEPGETYEATFSMRPL